MDGTTGTARTGDGVMTLTGVVPGAGEAAGAGASAGTAGMAATAAGAGEAGDIRTTGTTATTITTMAITMAGLPLTTQEDATSSTATGVMLTAGEMV